MGEPHESDRFRNTSTWTIQVTFTVAGGARPQTAWRRAERAAERIANAAARLADVVEVRAVAGMADTEGQILSPSRVRFAAANSGQGTYSEPGKLDRYVDADHERAVVSLAEANARHRARETADRDRRRELGCANTWRTSWSTHRACACAYCEPDRHLDTLTGSSVGRQINTPVCLCGRPDMLPGGRCSLHRNVELVVFDDDPPGLRALADELARRQRTVEQTRSSVPSGALDRSSSDELA